MQIKVKGAVSEAYRVIPRDEHEAKKMAVLMFRNENRYQILATEFDVRPENDQSPVDEAIPNGSETMGLEPIGLKQET